MPIFALKWLIWIGYQFCKPRVYSPAAIFVTFGWDRRGRPSNDGDSEKSEAVMSALESINDRYGLNTVVVGSHKQGGDWHPKTEQRSPDYTTKWSELVTVKA